MTWWIATTAPSCEFRASAQIEDVGLDVWVPSRQVEVRRSQRHTKAPAQVRTYAMFPGYLFVHAFSSDWREDWHTMRGARDVRGILALAGGGPAHLSDTSADRLRAHLAPVIPVVTDAYRIGETVRVIDQGNPFCGLDGIVDACDRNTVRILLDMMGRKTRVDILGDRLERVA